MHSFLPVKPPKKFTAPKRTKKRLNPKEDMRELQQSKRVRIRFIDNELATTGYIGAKTIVAKYNVSIYVAHSDIRRYELENPDSTIHDKANERRIPSETFTPLFTDEVKYVKPT